MHHIGFVIYPGFELLDMAGPSAAFNGANRVLRVDGKEPFYAIDLISSTGGMVASSSGVAVDTQEIARPLEWNGSILIAGAEQEPLLEAMVDPTLRKTLPFLARKSQRYGSVCSGVFLLAAIGLVEGRRVATHWDACASLAAAFPHLNVDADALFVVDGKLWTSAGVTTGIDMALAMISHDLGAAVAGQVAKLLVLYARRPGYQSQFSPILKAQVDADSPFAELVEWVHSNLSAPMDVPKLAARAKLTERTFHRKFFAEIGETPARFVETARLDAARMLLSRGMPLKSVAAEVGLSPVSRLSESFGRRFGVSPRLFRTMHANLDAGSS